MRVLLESLRRPPVRRRDNSSMTSETVLVDVGQYEKRAGEKLVLPSIVVHCKPDPVLYPSKLGTLGQSLIPNLDVVVIASR
jgi:hypothetical protein